MDTTDAISLENRPTNLSTFRKAATIDAVFMTEPFTVLTQEGPMVISPETVDDWDGGYYVAFPADGSKPYSISPSFFRGNYVPA